MFRKYWPLFLVFGVVLLLYYPIFWVYFSGDDFFHFKVSRTDGSLLEFINLFGFHPFSERLIAFYRPLTRELIYFSFYRLFGLNHLPFRVLQLVIHFANITLVCFLFEKLFKSKYAALFMAFFFGISAANVGSLYYLAGGIQAQGALMFVLLTLLMFEKRYIASLITFLLALMSHELAIVTPFLLAGLVWIREKRFRLKNFSFLAFYFTVLIFYLYLNFSIIGFSSGETQYQLNFGLKTLFNSLSWYGVWAVGLPEMLVDYVGSGFALNPNLMKFWGNYFKIIFPSFFISLFLFLFNLALRVITDKKILKDKKIPFLMGWFFAGLLPVLFLPVHKKTYYLQVSLPAFWGLIGYFVWRASRGVALVLTVSLLVLNVASMKIADKTYWAAQRGRIAGRLIAQVQKQYPSLPRGAAVYFKNDPNYPELSGDWKGSSNQAYFILNGSDALQLLYKDNSLKVYYEDRDKKPESAFELTAVIN